MFLFAALPFYLLSRYRAGRYVSLAGLILLTVFMLPRSFDELGTRRLNTQLFALVSDIKRERPGKTFAVYNCHNRNTERDFSLTYLLDAEKKLGDDVKIGFADETCRYPDVLGRYDKLGVLHPRILVPTAFDLSDASASAIKGAGWDLLTPKILFDINAKWWFKEQP
jgi:hypothetical protein